MRQACCERQPPSWLGTWYWARCSRALFLLSSRKLRCLGPPEATLGLVQKVAREVVVAEAVVPVAGAVAAVAAAAALAAAALAAAALA